MSENLVGVAWVLCALVCVSATQQHLPLGRHSLWLAPGESKTSRLGPPIKSTTLRHCLHQSFRFQVGCTNLLPFLLLSLRKRGLPLRKCPTPHGHSPKTASRVSLPRSRHGGLLVWRPSWIRHHLPRSPFLSNRCTSSISLAPC
jgi:hypothetical protein